MQGLAIVDLFGNGMNDTNRYPPVTLGMRLGFKTSLILTCAYWILGISVETGRQMWLLHEIQIWMLPVARFAGMLPFFFLIALVAIAFLGTLTGGLIGELWTRIGQRLDGRVFALLSLILCVSIVVGFHVIYQIQVNFFIPAVLNDSGWYSDTVGLLVSYPFWVGVPSLLYLAAGAWGGYFFWKVQQGDTNDSV